MPWRRTRMLHRDWAEIERGASTQSAADGSYALRLLRGALVNVRTSKAGTGTAEVAACQAGERVRIVLTPGATLVVTTVDAQGAPVPGTALRLNPWGSQISTSAARAPRGHDGSRPSAYPSTRARTARP